MGGKPEKTHKGESPRGLPRLFSPSSFSYYHERAHKSRLKSGGEGGFYAPNAQNAAHRQSRCFRKKGRVTFSGMQIFLFAQGRTAREFEGNEKFFRGGKVRSRIFLLAAYTPPLRMEGFAPPTCGFFDAFFQTVLCRSSENGLIFGAIYGMLQDAIVGNVW